MATWKGLIILTLATFASWILANTVDTSTYELGALVNLLWPCFVGAILFILFMVICWISKDQKFRIITLVIFCIYLIYIGLAFHLEKDYWPLVF